MYGWDFKEGVEWNLLIKTALLFAVAYGTLILALCL